VLCGNLEFGERAARRCGGGGFAGPADRAQTTQQFDPNGGFAPRHAQQKCVALVCEQIIAEDIQSRRRTRVKTLRVEQQPVPLVVTAEGVVRIEGTRVPLETVVRAWADTCSDPALEELLSTTLLVRWFVGLPLSQAAPDHSTLADFHRYMEGRTKHKIAVGVRRRIESGRRRIGAGRCLTYDSRRSGAIRRRAATAIARAPTAIPDPPSLQKGLQMR